MFFSDQVELIWKLQETILWQACCMKIFEGKEDSSEADC